MVFSVFDRGRGRPQVPLVCAFEEPLRLDEARFAAWASALEQEHPREGRPHPGRLPDIDWSRTEAAQRHAGPFAWLWRRLRTPASKDGGVSGAPPTVLAQASRKPYVARAASGQAHPATDEDRRAA